jgi:hypothetical protein
MPQNNAKQNPLKTGAIEKRGTPKDAAASPIVADSAPEPAPSRDEAAVSLAASIARLDCVDATIGNAAFILAHREAVVNLKLRAAEVLALYAKPGVEAERGNAKP